jgi:hypothetical protein
MGTDSFAQKKKIVKQEQILPVNPIYVYPQEQEFKAFAGLDLANQLHVAGTVPKVYDFNSSYTEGVNITLLDGPGAIGGEPGREGGIDSVWYWHYKPFDSDTGKTFTIRYQAGATRHGGRADTMTGSFRVHVYPLVPQSPVIYDPKDEHNYPTAYTGVPFRADGKYVNLDGDYRIEFRICDQELVCEAKSFFGPYAEFTSHLAKDEGKDITISIYYRSYQSSVWIPMRTDHAIIKPAPLTILTLNKLDPSKELRVQAYYGLDGHSSGVSPEALEVASDGYFETSAVKIPKTQSAGDGADLHEVMVTPNDFVLRPTERYKQMGDKELPVQMLFKDPATGKQSVISVTLLPPSEASR